MLVRIASTLILAPLVLFAAWQGGWTWTGLTALAAALALREALAIARACGRRPNLVVGLPMAAALAMAPTASEPGLALGILAAGCAAAFAAQMARRPEDRAIEDWALTVALAAYIGGCAALAVALRLRPDGAVWALWLLALTWTNDSLAFLVGRALGRHPMAPHISPKKTWEGFAGATIGTVALGAALPSTAAALGVPALAGLSPLTTAAMGLALAFVGPLGDLSKSLLKRQAGVKDSGHLIPGHGGMLDRIDSLLLGAALVWWAAVLLGR